MEEGQGGLSSRAAVGVSGASSSGVQDPLALILTAIHSSQLEMPKLREEMRVAQEEAVERQPNKKKEKPYHFQKKGHEKQFAFNDGVADKLEEVEGHLTQAALNLADGPAKDALEKARKAIKEGKEQLTHRQKLIKVADRSKLDGRL